MLSRAWTSVRSLVTGLKRFIPLHLLAEMAAGKYVEKRLIMQHPCK